MHLPKPVLLGLGLIALIASVAGGIRWVRSGATRDAVLSYTPLRPDLSATSPTLRDRIAAAESAAHSRSDPIAGLAELSRLYHANGFLAEANACYVGLTALEPEQPLWPHLHASILAGYGQAEPALALWQQVIERAPTYLPARLRTADLLLKTNQTDAAAAAYRDVLKLEPNNPYATLGLGRIEFEAERWTEARPLLEKVVGQTRYALGYDLIVALYERLGLPDRAAAVRGAAKASGAFRDPPDPWLDALMVDCYDVYRLALDAGTKARSGETTAARELLERAVALAPSDLSAHFQLATLFEQQRNTMRALELYRRCTQLDPSFADGWARLSDLLARTNDPAQAARVLATGLAQCPDSPGLHLMRARRLEAAGQTTAAFADFRTAIRIRPNEPDAYLEFGIALIRAGNNQAGIDQIQLALNTDPANPSALGILAFNAINLGNQTDADTFLTQVALQPRIEASRRRELLAAYRERFGHIWTQP